MRFLLIVTIPVETGNAAARAGKLGMTIGSILAELFSICPTRPTFRPSRSLFSSLSTPKSNCTR